MGAHPCAVGEQTPFAMTCRNPYRDWPEPTVAPRPSVTRRLRAHLAGDGTPNDDTTDDLYREAHGITDGRETDLEDVERWAWETVNFGHCLSAIQEANAKGLAVGSSPH